MNKFIYFCIGATLGSVTTWYIVKKKYEQIAQEEIDSVKEVFSAAKEDSKKVENFINDIKEGVFETDKVLKNWRGDTINIEDKPDLMSYVSQNYGEVRKSERDARSGLYIIAPGEYGDFPDYRQVCVTYYAGDKTLVDDNGNVLDDIDGSITIDDFIDHFGEYEPDSVHMRDDMRCCDYEILYNEDSFREVQ